MLRMNKWPGKSQGLPTYLGSLETNFKGSRPAGSPEEHLQTRWQVDSFGLTLQDDGMVHMCSWTESFSAGHRFPGIAKVLSPPQDRTQ